MTVQNEIERIKDLVNLGKMTKEQGNVELVRAEGVRIVHKVPREIRKVLNAAVKRGELGHLKSKGVKSEVYFHPNSLSKALKIRAEEINLACRLMNKVCV